MRARLIAVELACRAHHQLIQPDDSIRGEECEAHRRRNAPSDCAYWMPNGLMQPSEGEAQQ